MNPNVEAYNENKWDLYIWDVQNLDQHLCSY